MKFRNSVLEGFVAGHHTVTILHCACRALAAVATAPKLVFDRLEHTNTVTVETSREHVVFVLGGGPRSIATPWPEALRHVNLNRAHVDGAA